MSDDTPAAVVQGLQFLLTRIGSWTESRWDQHLRYQIGDEHAETVIAWLAERGVLPHIPDGSGRALQERTTAAAEVKCAKCGGAIRRLGESWRHVGATYRHVARPEAVTP